ncbi:MAG: UDP-N-acetylmuramoyl-L-alanine--D-glutamate ligase [Aerococcus sp.]|nr:UDP-N-acetylmuramoyl-L-alanine--D-glutamate ligase [Aerococcus sp.]
MTVTIDPATLSERTVLLLGLGKSGQSTLKHLAPQVKQFLVYEDEASSRDEELAQYFERYAVRYYTKDAFSDQLLETVDLIVKTPGITYDHPVIVAAAAQDLPVVTDVEVAGVLTEASIVGITGSNGKTTTTSLTYEIFKQGYSNGEVFLGGNIGVPVFDTALDAKVNDQLVWELSSFQLQGTQEFRPQIAAILNIYPTHLDYHGSMAAYIAAKWHVTANQTADDYLILNADQPELWTKRQETAATVVPVTMTQDIYDGAWYDEQEQQLMWRDEVIMTREELRLPGDHNVQNALNAIAIAKCAGIDNEAIVNVLQTFTSVKHRIQFVSEINDRKFYNDSKATNDEATLTALNSFNTPTVWIAGGLERHIPIDDLLPALSHVKSLVTTGETSEKFAELAAKAGISIAGHGEWIEDAVSIAYSHSEPGDTILFSPASASWDQYPNFEVRGDRFIQAVLDLSAREGGATCD